jgi:hypothetical protein
MPVGGPVPCRRSGDWDLSDRIRVVLGLFLVAMLLLPMELGVVGKGVIPLNKCVVANCLKMRGSGAIEPLLAGRGCEEVRQSTQWAVR